MTRPELAEVMDRLNAQGLIPPVDPVQVQTKRKAYLRERGRAIAQDLDLDQIKDADAIELGRLDVIAHHPDLDPALAVLLAMVAEEREAGSLGRPLDQDTAPELHPETAEDPEPPTASAARDGGAPVHERAQVPGSRDGNGKVDPITEYLQNVPDPADDWEPFR
jgi:hypothetical protein